MHCFSRLIWIDLRQSREGKGVPSHWKEHRGLIKLFSFSPLFSPPPPLRWIFLLSVQSESGVWGDGMGMGWMNGLLVVVVSQPGQAIRPLPDLSDQVILNHGSWVAWDPGRGLGQVWRIGIVACLVGDWSPVL